MVKHNRQIFFYISLPRDHIRKSHLECDLRFVINTLDATTPENAMDTSAIIPYFHINRVIVIVSLLSCHQFLFSYSLLLKGNTYSHIPNVHPFPILGKTASYPGYFQRHKTPSQSLVAFAQVQHHTVTPAFFSVVLYLHSLSERMLQL